MGIWRDTMRPPRFFGFDARATVPMMAFLMNMNMNTLFFAFCGMVAFGLLERKGLTVPAALRTARCWVAGPVRPAVPWWLSRKYIDYGT